MQYASISKRLLRELPRFFSSFEGALGEIFQNALRAGATCVEVFWDEGRSVLTVVDDGGGIENADMLLTAGATGWTEAIEPAGVGFFALLRPEWVRRVTYRSRDWRLECTPRLLEGEAADYQVGGWFPGTAVELELVPGVLTLGLLERVRGLYPYRVVLHRGDEVRELPPWRSWEPDTVVETPVGRVEWKCGWHATEAVWEWRAIPSRILGEVLGRVADQHHYPRLAHELVSGCGLRWYVDPQTGVRPKLPDRNELQGDRALEGACTVLVNALVEWALGVARELTRDWPAQVDNLYRQASLSSCPTWSIGLLKGSLPVLGWHCITYPDIVGVSIWEGSDGWGIDRPDVRRFARDPQVVEGWESFLTLNTLGHPAVVSGESRLGVEVEGLRISPQSPYVALARRIRIGEQEVPYLITDDPPFDLPALDGWQGCIVYAGEVDDFLRDLEHPLFCSLVFWVDERNYRWVSDGEIDLEAVRTALTLQVLEGFAPPERVHAYKLELRREQFGQEIEEIVRQLMRVKSAALPGFEDRVQKVLDGLTGLLADLRALG